MKWGIGSLLVLAASCASPRETDAAHTPASSLPEAIRLARARYEGLTVAHAGVHPTEPGKYWVMFHSQGRLKGVEVDTASGAVVETTEIRADESFFPEMESRLPSMKLDLDRAIEIALGENPDATARHVDPGLAGDGPETRVTYQITVQVGDDIVVRRVDLSTGDLIETVKNEIGDDFDLPEIEPGTVTRDFDAESTGALPEGWTIQATGPQSLLATWEAVADGSVVTPARALALTRANHDSSSTFNVCRSDEIRFGDGTIELSMKPVSGVVDQGGGPMWHVKDKDNYYVCRANPLEGNFRLYVVEDGERRQLASASVDVAAGAWHAIRVEHQGTRIACSLDGTKLFEAIDATFPEPGWVGFWTKADAATAFDDLRVTSPGEPGDGRR